jgi:general secretion pathway protein G
VVTIIALLATLIVPRIWENVGKARSTATQAGIASISNSVRSYLLDQGLSRANEDFDLEVLLLPPECGGGSGGPYLSKKADLLDPWKRPFIIKVPGDVNQYDYDIVSAGEDGEFGTPDDIAGPK